MDMVNTIPKCNGLRRVSKWTWLIQSLSAMVRRGVRLEKMQVQIIYDHWKRLLHTKYCNIVHFNFVVREHLEKIIHG